MNAWGFCPHEPSAPVPVRLHPNMGERYRQQVTGLIEALNEPGRRTEQRTQDIYNRMMAQLRLMDYLKASINKTKPDLIVQ
jgi:hypothetical protein